MKNKSQPSIADFLQCAIVVCLGVGVLIPMTAVAGTRDDIEALQLGQQDIQQRLQQLEANLQNQGLMELAQMLEQMQAEIRDLRGVLEQQNHEIEGLRKRQRELYLDIDRRLSDVELQGINAQTGTPTEDATTPDESTATTTAPPAGDANQERAEYKAAFETLMDGRHEQAIKNFAAFLEKYPHSNYADNAQYWLGEAHYVLRQFEEAITEFNKVLERFPRSLKIADAKLKIGYTFYELRKWEDARAILTETMNKHPNTTAAGLAKKRLLTMSQEGR